MDDIKFKKFLKAALENEKVIYGNKESEPYSNIIDEIYEDVSKLKYYVLDGRLENILIDLLKNPKYEIEGYGSLLKDLTTELEKLVIPNMILLPINFIKTSILKKELVLNDYLNIFLPTKKDIKNFKIIESNYRNKNFKEHIDERYNDNLSKYFKSKLKCKLYKGHILLSKDSSFFNYPILSIFLENTDFKVEKESGRIAEGVYSILRIIDFIKRKHDYSWGLLDKEWLEPAHTYVVYYNEDYNKTSYNSYDGYSFRFNFSYYLDISTECFIENLDLFTSLIDIYIKSCFLDYQKYSTKETKKIDKWNNSIKMLNTAYEFVSIEKYDACVLLLCAILESLFLKNEGRNKLEKLIEKINIYANEIYDKKKLERINNAIRSIYKFRNKFLHEGRGYEVEFLLPRSLNSSQGTYRGMKPFTYQGAIPPYKEIVDIMITFKFICELLIDDRTIYDIKTILNKK